MKTPRPEGDKEVIDLIRRAQVGDDIAFGELYGKYRRKLYKHVFFKYVSRRRDGDDAANDVVSITFSQAQQDLPKYDPAKGAFYSWLCWRAKRVWIEYIIKPSNYEVNIGGGRAGDGDGDGDPNSEDVSDTSNDAFTSRTDWIEAGGPLLGGHVKAPDTVAEERYGNKKVTHIAFVYDSEWGDFERWDGIEDALDAVERGETPKDGLARDIAKLSSFQRDVLRHLIDPDTSPGLREIERKVAKTFLTDGMRKSLYRKLEVARIGEERARIEEEVEKNLGAVCPISHSPTIRKKAKDGDPYAQAIMEAAEPDNRGLEYEHKPKAKVRKQIDISESMGVNKKKFDKAIYLIRKGIKNK